jgi:hypothetical protein
MNEEILRHLGELAESEGGVQVTIGVEEAERCRSVPFLGTTSLPP